MVLSATRARVYPLLEESYVYGSSSDFEEIKQGLREVRDGMVKPLNELEEQFGIRKGLS